MGDGVANLWWLFVWSDCLLISPAPKVEEGWFSDTFRRLNVFRCVCNDTWTVFIVNKLGMQYLTVLRGWCWWCGQCTEVGTNGSQRAPRQMNLSWQPGDDQSRSKYSNFRNGDPRAEKIWQRRLDISTFKPLSRNQLYTSSLYKRWLVAWRCLFFLVRLRYRSSGKRDC